MDVIAEDERFAAMLLSRVGYYHLQEIRTLYTMVGSAQAVVAASDDIRQVLPDASPRLVQLLSHLSDHRQRVADELAYVETEGVRVLTPCDSGYPRRLWECVDAPLVLYARGEACLNARRVVSVVGTRRCTRYGQDLIHSFVHRLKELCPEVLVVSGLAYGVDIHTHRAALDEGNPTVAVLAHGLDQIYPRMHRDTAVRMLAQGGLLTEFMAGTNADKRNFVQRNRIVAGISDVTVVVESANKGGSLITAGLANDYNREVMAFPGRVTDGCSAGCNSLIRANRAALITSAQDLVEMMGWETEAERRSALARGIQPELFPELSPEEQQVAQALQGSDKCHLNQLSLHTDLPISRLSGILFGLEMKGVVKMLPGGMYRLA